jgi:hypothetical protein
MLLWTTAVLMPAIASCIVTASRPMPVLLFFSAFYHPEKGVNLHEITIVSDDFLE